MRMERVMRVEQHANSSALSRAMHKQAANGTTAADADAANTADSSTADTASGGSLDEAAVAAARARLQARQSKGSSSSRKRSSEGGAGSEAARATVEEERRVTKSSLPADFLNAKLSAKQRASLDRSKVSAVWRVTIMKLKCSSGQCTVCDQYCIDGAVVRLSRTVVEVAVRVLARCASNGLMYTAVSDSFQAAKAVRALVLTES
jgi:Pyruvate/2-oxoacid:ferredoxin oxidoreductase delta subunit